MFKAISKLFKAGPQLRPSALDAEEAAFARDISPLHSIPHTKDDEDIPRYPPFMRGLPAKSPDELLGTHIDAISQIRELVGNDKYFTPYYLETLKRYAAYSHLLPASQSHHHRGAGGLLRHGIETALWALQDADRVLIGGGLSPQRRRAMEARFQMSVFACALCHDIGKPITDLTVTDREGAITWNPIGEAIYVWAQKNGIDRYFIRWNEGRKGKHEEYEWSVFWDIVGLPAKQWISEEIVVFSMINDVMKEKHSSDNVIHNLVIKADMASVERDLKELGAVMAGHDIGVPVEKHLIDVMRRLAKDGTWTVNVPGARVWYIQGSLYLLWPASGENIALALVKDNIPGIPRSADSIADMLIERNIVVPYVNHEQDKSRTWTIAPQCLKEKNPKIKLNALRFKEVSMLIDPAPPMVDGDVLEEMLTATRLQDDADHAAEVEQETGEISPREHKPAPSSSAPKTATLKAEQQASAAPGAAQQPKAPEKMTKPPEKVTETVIDVLDLAAANLPGEVLIAFAQDLASGRRKWGEHAALTPKGELAVAWPEALTGYGIESKLLLADVAKLDWLVIDFMEPMKKIREAKIGSLNRKAVIFSKDVADAVCLAEKRAPRTGKHTTPVDAVEMHDPERPNSENYSEMPDLEMQEFEAERHAPTPASVKRVDARTLEHKAESPVPSPQQAKQGVERPAQKSTVTHNADVNRNRPPPQVHKPELGAKGNNAPQENHDNAPKHTSAPKPQQQDRQRTSVPPPAAQMEGKGVDKEPNVLEKIADAINSGAILAQTMTDLQGKWLEKEKIMFYAAKCVGLGMLRVQTLIKKQSQTWITKKEKEVEWIKLPH